LVDLKEYYYFFSGEKKKIQVTNIRRNYRK